MSSVYDFVMNTTTHPRKHAVGKGRRHLYERSSPVGGYDIFLSHTWQTPGRLGGVLLFFGVALLVSYVPT